MVVTGPGWNASGSQAEQMRRGATQPAEKVVEGEAKQGWQLRQAARKSRITEMAGNSVHGIVRLT